MRDLVGKRPEDSDAAVMLAEALMDLQPWDYYDEKLQPRGHTAEVVRTLEAVSGEPVPAVLADRRPGDPPQLVAGADRIRERLGWVPKHDDLEGIVRSALAWERSLDWPGAATDGSAPRS